MIYEAAIAPSVTVYFDAIRTLLEQQDKSSLVSIVNNTLVTGTVKRVEVSSQTVRSSPA